MQIWRPAPGIVGDQSTLTWAGAVGSPPPVRTEGSKGQRQSGHLAQSVLWRPAAWPPASLPPKGFPPRPQATSHQPQPPAPASCRFPLSGLPASLGGQLFRAGILRFLAAWPQKMTGHLLFPFCKVRGQMTAPTLQGSVRLPHQQPAQPCRPGLSPALFGWFLFLYFG